MAVSAALFILLDYGLRIGNPFYGVMGTGLRKIKPRLESDRSRQEIRYGMITLASMLGGGAFGYLLALGTGAAAIAGVVGAFLGMGGSYLVRRSINDMKKTRIMREVAVLYETINFFTRGEGDEQRFTIVQALRYAAAITPTIRPMVQRCINSWAWGPARALERFAKEVDLPEANILSSVLTHAAISGMNYGRSAIEEGSRDLEELRHSLAEIRIANKPMYYTIYRGLPLVAMGGILLGPLVYHLASMLRMIFNS